MTALAIASFAAEGAFLRARTRAIADGLRIVGEWTPYASVALEGEDGTRGILPAAVAGGFAGAAGLFALQTWSAVFAYPFDSGARPPFSWQAFIPAPVEFGALTAAVAGVACFFWRAGLTRLHHPAFDLAEVEEASGGAFVLALAVDEGERANAALASLAAAGATGTRLVTR